MAPPATLEENISAYEGIRASLEADFQGRWVVFYDCKLVADYEDFQVCAAETVRRYGRGPYLIRQVGAVPLQLPSSVLLSKANGNH